MQKIYEPLEKKNSQLDPCYMSWEHECLDGMLTF